MFWGVLRGKICAIPVQCDVAVMDDDAKEVLCREMERAGLVEPGEKQRWRCTTKGHAWGNALMGIALAAQFRCEIAANST
jgi:hypothetical protein